MKVFLVRHTAPDVEEGTCYGQTDLDVDKRFFSDSVDKIKQRLNGFEDYRIFSSPLQRCTLLADELAKGQEVTKDSRLAEINFGSWEMKKWSSIDKKEFSTWHENFVERSPEGGESYQEVYDRSSSFWEEFITKQYKRGENTIVVTHAGVIRAILANLLEMPLPKTFAIKLSYSAVIGVEIINEKYSLIEF